MIHPGLDGLREPPIDELIAILRGNPFADNFMGE